MQNDKRKVDVNDWRYIAGPITTRSTVPGLLSPTAVGMFGTLIIHTLIVTSLHFGSCWIMSQPHKTEVFEASNKGNAGSFENLVLMTLPAIANSNRAIVRDMPFVPAISKQLVRSLTAPDPSALLDVRILALNDEQLSQLSTVDGNSAEQAQLFGIYTGQIRARIERVWRRPRTAVTERSAGSSVTADESFQCEAQIVQDSSGYIQEILLPHCNGSKAWQLSLITAIREASPLPAPPSEGVFNHSIVLNFAGFTYVPGMQTDGYETVPRPPALVARRAVESNPVN